MSNDYFKKKKRLEQEIAFMRDQRARENELARLKAERDRLGGKGETIQRFKRGFSKIGSGAGRIMRGLDRMGAQERASGSSAPRMGIPGSRAKPKYRYVTVKRRKSKAPKKRKVKVRRVIRRTSQAVNEGGGGSGAVPNFDAIFR